MGGKYGHQLYWKKKHEGQESNLISISLDTTQYNSRQDNAPGGQHPSTSGRATYNITLEVHYAISRLVCR